MKQCTTRNRGLFTTAFAALVQINVQLVGLKPPQLMQGFYTALFSLFLSPVVLAADYSRELGLLAKACPTTVKSEMPDLQPQQVQNACACIGKNLEERLYALTVKPPTQQLSDLAMSATKACLDVAGRELAINQCVTNEDTRRLLSSKAGFTNKQFERYCHCHVNLTFDEIERGLNIDDPSSAKTIRGKSFATCVDPRKLGNANPQR